MDEFKIGDRVRVRDDKYRGFEPAPTRWFGMVGVIEADPGDYGVRFPGESNLIYILGEDLELLEG